MVSALAAKAALVGLAFSLSFGVGAGQGAALGRVLV